MRSMFRRRSSDTGPSASSRPQSATISGPSGANGSSHPLPDPTLPRSTPTPIPTASSSRPTPISISIPEEPPNYDTLDSASGASPHVSVMFGASPRYEEMEPRPDLARRALAASRRNTISGAAGLSLPQNSAAASSPTSALSSGVPFSSLGVSPTSRATSVTAAAAVRLGESPGGSDWFDEADLDIPMPATSGSLPVYSPDLARNELRLISTVHVHETHPAAAFFNNAARIGADPIAEASTSGGSATAGAAAPVVAGSYTTGGKRIKVTITRGADASGRGIVIKRGGVIEGEVEVGKGDHGVGLDVAVMGVVNTSFSVRGQWSLLDSTPILAEKVVLWGSTMTDAQSPTTTDPARPASPVFNMPDLPNNAGAGPSASGPSASSNGVNGDGSAPPSSAHPPLTRSASVSVASPNGNGPSSALATGLAMGAGAFNALTMGRSSSAAAMPMMPRPIRRGSSSTPATGSPARGSTPTNSGNGANTSSTTGAGGVGMGVGVGASTLQPGATFKFSIPMPTSTFRDGRSELPPSCAVHQMGMQTTVEYYLRVKLSRSRFRMNETMHIPIRYDLRGFISPRRLRALSIGEGDNPGWKKIKLKGGTSKKSSVPVGVDASLLIPSPPIIFITSAADPPRIPFRLHFHSTDPLALATFSNPLECKFVVRVMRATMVRLGAEKQYRREEIPATVEVWRDDPVGNGNGSGGGSGGTTNGEAEPVRMRLNVEPIRTPNHPTHPLPSIHPGAFFAAASAGDARPPSSSGPSAVIVNTPTSPGTGPTLGLGLNGVSTTQPNGSSSSAPSPTSPTTHHETDHTSVIATTVRLVGEIKLHKEQLRHNLIQSLYCPDLVVSYVLEVGIQPRKGAVKEAFEHLWGGGGLEVVWGC